MQPLTVRTLAALPALAASLLGLYVLATLLGAVLVTAPAPDPKPRTIYILSTPIHAEIVVPIVDDVADWRGLIATPAFAGDPAERDLLADVATHASIGWGAESFYRNVRRLSDIRPRYVLDGLWDESLVHVTMIGDPAAIPGIIPLTLTEAGYRRLIGELRAAFALNDGVAIPVAGANYYANDGFFRGIGAYSPLVTCNEWVAARLRSAGVAVGRFTPFSQTLRFSLLRPPQGDEQRED